MNDMNSVFDTFINAILSLLPRSPFSDVSFGAVSDTAIGYLNWFFPVHTCLTIMVGWLAAIALYYMYSIVARWIKIIA